MPTENPLDWPPGWPRTPAHKREDARYRFARRQGHNPQPWTIGQAETKLRLEIARLGATSLVMSCNLCRRLDGGVLSKQRAPDDPGVAIYFTLDGEAVVMARDAFTRVEENVRSLTLAVEGMRQLERHGGGQMMKRAFSGFKALPPPDAPIAMSGPGELPKPWHQVLECQPDSDWNTIRSAYFKKMRETENEAARLPLNLAYQAAAKFFDEGL